VGALDKDVEQVIGRNLEKMTVGETKAAMMVGGARSRSNHAGTQSPARTMAHGRVKGERSHGGDLVKTWTEMEPMEV